jgi:hypothetical protein
MRADASADSLDHVLGRLRDNIRFVANKLYEGRLERSLGMPLDHAVQELARFEKLADNPRKLSRYYRSGVGFRDVQQAAAAHSAIQRMRVFDSVLPSMFELGSLIYREIQEVQLELQEVQRRTQLRGRLDETADSIAMRILDGGADDSRAGSGWNAVVTEVGNGLDALTEPLHAVLSAIDARSESLGTAIAALGGLLEYVPNVRA